MAAESTRKITSRLAINTRRYQRVLANSANTSRAFRGASAAFREFSMAGSSRDQVKHPAACLVHAGYGQKSGPASPSDHRRHYFGIQTAHLAAPCRLLHTAWLVEKRNRQAGIEGSGDKKPHTHCEGTVHNRSPQLVSCSIC